MSATDRHTLPTVITHTSIHILPGARLRCEYDPATDGDYEPQYRLRIGEGAQGADVFIDVGTIETLIGVLRGGLAVQEYKAQRLDGGSSGMVG